MAGWLQLFIFNSWGDILKYAIRFEVEIHMVQAHRIKAEVGNAFCNYFSFFFSREAGAEAEVRAPEFGASSNLKIKMSIFDFDEAMLASRGVKDFLASIKDRSWYTLIIRRSRRVRWKIIRDPLLAGICYTYSNKYQED